MSSPNSKSAHIIRHVATGQECCDPKWEAAYERFETPEQEIAKFTRRLRRFGFERLPKDLRIAEMFCGRGNGLVALDRLGFANVDGIDLSATLLEKYRGPATLHLADCMDLPMETGSYDVVIVQGGLHHLLNLPGDLDATLAGIKRILQPSGTLYVVEPWRTPFLTFAHFVVEQPWMRRIYAKGDALAEMTDHERPTYEQWLAQPQSILEVFQKYFTTKDCRIAWGKIAYTGKPHR
tara:strand:- start:53230 stop:53937 length:708 start_codon:yes stop_codon:yes gene_type:complete